MRGSTAVRSRARIPAYVAFSDAAPPGYSHRSGLWIAGARNAVFRHPHFFILTTDLITKPPMNA
jgi:hypothetical protein